MKQTVKLIQSDTVIRLPFEFCIQCGSNSGMQMHSFEQTEDNPIAQFARLAGDISILADKLLKKQHTVEAPFCGGCFRKFSSLNKTYQIFPLIFVCVIFVTILAAMTIGSYFGINASVATLGLGIGLAIFIRLYARYYVWKNSPTITKVNKKKIVLKVPGRGKFVCER